MVVVGSSVVILLSGAGVDDDSPCACVSGTCAIKESYEEKLKRRERKKKERKKNQKRKWEKNQKR